MSKKRDDSYFAAQRKKNQKFRIILIAAAAAAVIGLAAGVLAGSQPSPYGPVGSAHEHAVFAIKLDGNAIDFSQDKYQVKSRLIHVENRDGTTLHRHATDVPFSEFLKSVRMSIVDGCFTNDDGQKFCDDGDKSLKLFVNGEQVDSINDYVLYENDHLLVIYGNESSDEIKAELDALQQLLVKK
jgi:hypothetical protein